MAEVSDINRQIARHAAGVFGGQPKVAEFTYDFTDTTIDMLSCRDAPQKGVTSYATTNLSDHPLIKDGREYNTRLEIVGCCGNRFDYYPNVIASAAACVHHDRHFCAPGVVFPDLIQQYDEATDMHHLMFLPPFLWEPGLETLKLDDRQVAWLLAVPISDAELAYAKAHGPAKLEDVFEDKQIDIFNLRRASVL